MPTETIKRVRVFFAPNREAAGPLIASKHTRDQIERWSTIMQARFFRSLAKVGLTPQEIATRYGRTPGDVAGFLRVDEMYDIACAMDLPENVRQIVHNPRLFPAAVLERLIEIPKAREVLGIEFDDRGGVRGKVHLDEFRKGYRRILTDIATKKVDTRTLNRVEDAEKYLRALGADRPNLSRRGKFTVDDVRGTKSPADETTAVAAATGKAKAPRVAYGLIPSGVKCGVANPRIRQIFEELRRLRPVERYPNSCAALLRILLELSMGNYLDKTGKIKPLLDKARKENRPSDWYPTWKQMLRAILDDSEITTISPLARKHLNGIGSDRNTPIDGFVHSRFELAEPGRLRNIASAMEDILKVMLDESAWPKPAPAKK